MRKQLIKFGLLLSCIVMCGQSNAAPVFENGIGVRTKAMGDAGVALANRNEAMIWNPAGIAQISGTQVSWMQTKIMNEVNYQAIGLSRELFHGLSIGVGYIRSSIEGINGRNNTGQLTGEAIEYINTQMMGTVAFNFWETMYAGATYKKLTSTLSSKEASGTGLDVGLQIRLTTNNWIGVTMMNAIQPELEWNTSSRLKTRLRQETKLGIGVELFPNLLVGIDMIEADDGNQNINIGAEANLINNQNIGVVIRGGLKDSRYTAGLGIQLVGIEINYAYEQGKETYMDATQWIGINIGVNEFNWKTELRKVEHTPGSESALNHQSDEVPVVVVVDESNETQEIVSVSEEAIEAELIKPIMTIDLTDGVVAQASKKYFGIRGKVENAETFWVNNKEVIVRPKDNLFYTAVRLRAPKTKVTFKAISKDGEWVEEIRTIVVQ